MPRVVALAGGVGGAKLALGLQLVVAPGDLSVVVNTGDDQEFHGLLVCPDHDTVLYTLAGLADRERGWGLAGETWAAADQLARLGEPTWFAIGDRDLALHVHRTRRARDAERLTLIALDVAARLGVASRILPMADEPVRTRVRTGSSAMGRIRLATPSRAATSSAISVRRSASRARLVRWTWSARSRSPIANQVGSPSRASWSAAAHVSPARPQPRSRSARPARV